MIALFFPSFSTLFYFYVWRLREGKFNIQYMPNKWRAVETHVAAPINSCLHDKWPVADSHVTTPRSFGQDRLVMDDQTTKEDNGNVALATTPIPLLTTT